MARLRRILAAQGRLWFHGRGLGLTYLRWHVLALPTVAWAKLRRIPVVVEVNGPYQDLFTAWPRTRWLDPLVRWTMQQQLRWADAIITVTPRLKEWARSQSRRPNVHCITNGADTELFRPGLRPRRDLPQAYALFFGALARYQGIDTLLAAVRDPAWPRTVKLVIAGDGAERRKVEEAAQNGSVVYLDLVPHEEIPEIISGSLVGLVPKTNVGGHAETGLYPLKLFETLACGVPVVATDLPGQADVVRTAQCGLVVPPEDPKSLAAGIAYLFQHPDERLELGRRGRLAAVEHHSWDAKADETAKVLEGLLAK